MPRFLIGPVDPAFADRYLSRLRAAGDCLAFGPGGDLPAAPAGGWADVAAALPVGWAPDLVVVWLPYQSVPAWVWAAPVPVVGLAADWNLLWHLYRHTLPLCDAVLTDGPGVEALARAGVSHAHPATLFGLGRDFLEHPFPASDAPRDIDVLFVGNLHPAVQAGRLPWLARLAELGDRCRVVITTGVFGADYRALLGRAKVVFNQSVRGECNQRAFEAALAGAVLLQEAGNPEVAEHFAPGVEYREYTADDLAAVIEGLLADPAARTAVAAAGRGRAQGCAFDDFLTQGLDVVLADGDDLADRVATRVREGRRPGLAGRVWQRVSRSGPDHDPGLGADLGAAGSWYDLGLLAPDRAAAEDRFRRAGGNRLAALGLADALAARGAPGPATDLLRALLTEVDQATAVSPAERDSVPPPFAFDWARFEWECAGWANPADARAEAAAKGALVRWAAHSRLADLTGDLAHYFEAALLAPHIPATRAALGCALARAGRAADAVPHLRAAVDESPFDRTAARALFQALTDLGRGDQAAAVAAARRRLHRAAPDAVPAESWFAVAVPRPTPWLRSSSHASTRPP